MFGSKEFTAGRLLNQLTGLAFDPDQRKSVPVLLVSQIDAIDMGDGHNGLLFGSGANGRIWPAMMSAELPEGWAWAS